MKAKAQLVATTTNKNNMQCFTQSESTIMANKFSVHYLKKVKVIHLNTIIMQVLKFTYNCILCLTERERETM